MNLPTVPLIVTEITYIIRYICLAILATSIFIFMVGDREKMSKFLHGGTLLAKIVKIAYIIGCISFIIDLPKIWGWVK